VPGQNEERVSAVCQLAMEGTARGHRRTLRRNQAAGKPDRQRPNPAVWGFTDKDRAQIRAKESAVLERMATQVEQIIQSPLLQHSAIGKPIEDPRNPGTYMINESVQVAALRERRLLSGEFRRLTGADASASDRTRDVDEADLMRLAEIRSRSSTSPAKRLPARSSAGSPSGW
jgi:hypothetical protein